MSVNIRQARESQANQESNFAVPDTAIEDFFENGALALHLVGSDGTILRANKAELDLLGYSAADYIGHNIAEFHADQQAVADILARLKRGETLREYPAKLRARDGAIKHVKITSSGHFRDGSFLNTRCFTVDVTELERTRETAARRMTELTALYQFMRDLHRAETLSEVYEAALDAIFTAVGCDRASILLFDESGVMRFVAWRGLSDAYREAVDGHSPWKPNDQNAEPICIEDIDASDIPDPLKRVIRSEGISALGFVPLIVNGKLIGKFMIYYDQRHAFDSGVIDLALTTARQIAIGVERKRSDEARRRAEEKLLRNEGRLRLAVQTGKVGIWEWDIATDEITWSDSLYPIHGVTKNEFDATVEGFMTLVHPEDRARVSAALKRTLEEDAPYELELRAIKPDGRVAWLFTSAIVLREGGRPTRMLGATVDVTEHKQAEEKFRLAVEAAPSGMILCDEAGRIVLVNAHAERLFGYSRDDLVERNIEVLVPERFRGVHPQFRNEFGENPETRAMGAGRDLFAVRKDGNEVPVEIGLSPIHTSDGMMVLCSVVDISERKHAEAQRELLLEELNHRVKNTLSVVQAIAHQTFKGTDAASSVRAAFEGRLMALGAAHSVLTQSSWESASLGQLAADALKLNTDDHGRFSLAGPKLLLRPKQALAMAMALHELCTNAVKYGALSNETGSVSVKWSRLGKTELRFRVVWQEIDGPPVTPAKHRGFGSLMIERMLAHELNGEVQTEFHPKGLICTITAPL